MALGTARKQTQTLLAQTIIEKEPVMECSLMLTTLSGETFQVSLSVAKFDRFEAVSYTHLTLPTKLEV